MQTLSWALGTLKAELAAVIPLQLIGFWQLPLLPACPGLQLQYCSSHAQLPVLPVPCGACSSSFLLTSSDTQQLLPAELEDELGPGTGSREGLSLWGTRIMIICLFENGFGLQDPTTTSYRLQLIEDSVVIAHIPMGTL